MITVCKKDIAYDKHLTPTNTMGAVAEMFRQWPGSIRTDHPARSVCAWGKHAKYIAAEHTLSKQMYAQNTPENMTALNTAPYLKMESVYGRHIKHYSLTEKILKR